MSTQLDAVEVRIGDLVHTGWTAYEIDSDLMTPADAWHVRLAQPGMVVPPEVVPGATVAVRVGGELVLSGWLDERTLTVATGRHELTLTGRDGAGRLLDCSSPLVGVQRVSIDQVLAKVLAPLGIPASRVFIDAASKGALREKVMVEPGDTAWDTLRRVAEANGLWPWFEPNGTLVVGGPRYDVPPVAKLVLRSDGQGNNVLSLSEKRSMVGRYSDVTVYGQSPAIGSGAGESDPRHAIKATKQDSGVPVYRPKIVVDHEAINTTIARARGSKIISDSRVRSYTLTATVAGHRTADGTLWTPGQRVQVQSEPHGVDATYFVMARRLTGDKSTGQRTALTLKEDRVWVLDAHPSTRKHRRGKNGMTGRIVDVGAGQ
jgi:prophage tail gpP-like protein